MKKGVKIFLIIILVILLAILLVLNLLANGLLFKVGMNYDCWGPPCNCEFANLFNETEMLCSCPTIKGLTFITGIFNINRKCEVKEIIICEGDVQIDARTEATCKYSWNILWFFP